MIHAGPARPPAWIANLALIGAVVALACAPAARAQPASVQVAAKFDRRQVLPGEAVTYTITISAQSIGRTRDEPRPTFTGFDVLGGPSTSRSHDLRIVNGVMSQREILHFSWRLVPTAEGTLTVPPTTFEVNGVTRPVPAATLEVASPLPGMQPPPDPRGPPAGSQPDARDPDPATQQPRARAEGSRPWNPGGRTTGQAPRFELAVRVEDREPWVGEEVVVTHVLLFDQSVVEYGERGAPEFPGFAKTRHDDVKPDPRSVRDPATNAYVHSEADLARWTLVPLTPGTKTLPPQEYVFTLGSRDPFEAMFGGGGRVQRSTPRSTIQVRPLPAGAPASFSGAVGSFQVSSRLEHDAVRAGDATALVVEVRGRGSLASVGAPRLALPPGLKAFDPEVTDESRRAADGHSEGMKRFRWPLLVTQAGEHVVPPIALAFFDPRTAAYVERATEPLNLRATPGEASAVAAVPTIQSTAQVERIGSDVRHVRSALGPWRPDVGIAPVPAWAWVLVAAGPLANIVLGLVALARRLRPADAATQRARRGPDRARARLSRAKSALQGGRRAEAVDLAARAVSGLVSDRLALGAEEPSPAEAARALTGAGHAETASRVERFLSDCDFARFAAGGSPEESSRIVDEARALVRTLASVKPRDVRVQEATA